MFTSLFWIDAFERVVKTVAQTLSVLFLSSGAVFNILTVDWVTALGISMGAGTLSLLSSIASASKAGTDTASLVVDTKPLEVK